MKITGIAVFACSVMVALAGCSSPTVSGVYLATESQDTILLQLTQSSDGHVSGTMSFVILGNDGSVSEKTSNITGTTDGKALTLTLQSQQLQFLGGSLNLSGQVVDDGLSLTIPAGNTAVNVAFKRSTVEAFQQESAVLSGRGQAIKAVAMRNSKIKGLNEATHALRTDLIAFVDWRRNFRGIDAFKGHYDAVLNSARRDLGELHRDEAVGTDYAHSQAQYQQSQIDYQSSQMDYLNTTVTSMIKDTRARMERLDTGIAQSLCFSRSVKVGDVIPDMGNCKELDRVVQDYRSAEKDTVETESQEESVIAAAGASLADIKKEAAATLRKRP